MKYICLQSKDVINSYNGKKIGYISDIEIDEQCFKITGIYIEKRSYIKLLCLLKGPPQIYIPVKNIITIGEDIIIVNIEC